MAWPRPSDRRDQITRSDNVVFYTSSASVAQKVNILKIRFEKCLFLKLKIKKFKEKKIQPSMQPRKQ